MYVGNELYTRFTLWYACDKVATYVTNILQGYIIGTGAIVPVKQCWSNAEVYSWIYHINYKERTI